MEERNLILRERGISEILPTVGALVACGVVGTVLGARLHRFGD